MGSLTLPDQIPVYLDAIGTRLTDEIREVSKGVVRVSSGVDDEDERQSSPDKLICACVRQCSPDWPCKGALSPVYTAIKHALDKARVLSRRLEKARSRIRCDGD